MKSHQSLGGTGIVEYAVGCPLVTVRPRDADQPTETAPPAAASRAATLALHHDRDRNDAMTDEQHTNRPRFSIVSAVYDVARYLPKFIKSIEQQTFDTANVEVIMVDDGSSDDSLSVLQAWAEHRPDLVTVLTKENGGQGSARNLGLDHATGEWVTFIDPDDWIADTYLQNVSDFIELDDRVRMVACHRVYFEEVDDAFRDGHPLKKMFRTDQLVNVNRRPSFFHGSAPAAFVRRDIVEQHDLRFNTRIRPNFEDGHFCIRYLLACDEPHIAFLRSAEYIYRRRQDGSSTLQGSVAQSGRYIEVPKFGYLDVLRRAHEVLGSVPLWIQYFVLYELSWYFSSEEKPNNNLNAASGELGREFVHSLSDICEYLDVAAIESFDVRRYKPEWRLVLLHGVRNETWHTPYALLQRYDPTKRIARVTFRYTGDPPGVRFTLSNQERQPFAEKTRTLRYFGQPLLMEQTAWVPIDGSLRVELDGKMVELRTAWPSTKTVSLSSNQIASKLTPRRRPGIRSRVRTRLGRARALYSRVANTVTTPSSWFAGWRSRAYRTFMLRLGASKHVRKRYARAWVLMDRIHDANDSAEHLFEFLRAERSEVNAWFTVEKDTDDWRRLTAKGCDRLVAHGSFRWKLLMLNCTDLISSHADIPIMNPVDVTSIQPAQWRFTFLQHGVIKDDLSNWLNSKRIDLFVTSTRDEWESIGGNDNGYVFTPLEVKLTGLPRFDALERASRRIDPTDIDTVLITPTWRYWLNPPLRVGSQRREVVEEFDQTEFAQRWTSLLSSERLRSIVEEFGCRLALLPHPNLATAASLYEAGPEFARLSFSSPDLHDVFARTIVNITDFSSTAFNAAYLRRPSIYYQFDQTRVHGGGHVGRAGYFSYEDDGFGPVVFDEDALLDNLAQILAAGGEIGEPYRSRIDSTFPFRDGRCCERVAEEIANMSKRRRLLTLPPHRDLREEQSS